MVRSRHWYFYNCDSWFAFLYLVRLIIRGGGWQYRCAWIGLFLILGSSQILAQPLPLVNTGITSFMDGMPAPRGWKFQQYFIASTADRINDRQGNEISGLPDVDLYALATQVGYCSEEKIFLDAHLDFAALLVVTLDEMTLETDGTGIGDMFGGVALQWDPIVIDSRPIFSHRLELDVILPVGRYDSDRVQNPSSNFFGISPYWAATLFLTERWTTSCRLHYLWNAKNSDPNHILFPGADSTQAGQAFHMNFATSYGITRHLRIGVSGYYLKQFTDAKVDGHAVSGTREEVLAIGPGLVYEFNSERIMVMNAYFDLFSENRPQGMLFVCRFAFAF